MRNEKWEMRNGKDKDKDDERRREKGERRKEMKGEGRKEEGGRLSAGMTRAESLSPFVAKIL